MSEPPADRPPAQGEVAPASADPLLVELVDRLADALEADVAAIAARDPDGERLVLDPLRVDGEPSAAVSFRDLPQGWVDASDGDLAILDGPSTDQALLARWSLRRVAAMPVSGSSSLVVTGWRDAPPSVERAGQLMGFFADLIGSVLRHLEADRRLAEKRIRQQTSLLDRTTDAIVECSPVGEILFWSRGAAEVYGWPAQEAIGRSFLTLTASGDEQPALREALRRTLADENWRGELRQRARGGHQLVVDSRWSVVHDDVGRATSFLVIATDVTERKRLESQFLRTQRLESLGTLAGGIAHDLNNVLAPILMSVNLLKRKLPDAEDQALLATLDGSARRGMELVKQVLWFARGVDGERSRIQVGQLIHELRTMAGETFSKTIDIVTDTASDLPEVEGDATQLYQVIMNLCLNARDAMAAGGRLTLQARPGRIGRSQVQTHPEAEEGPAVVVTVSDTGAGIADEHLDKIFDPFFTTKSAGKGSGLGLTTAHSIVTSHGGVIEVSSRPGQGSTFRVYLPAVGREAPTGERADGEGRSASLRGGRVLVVDDDEAVLRLSQAALESSGFEVVTVEGGARAVDELAADPQAFTAVVCDMSMPVMDGPATIRGLRELRPDLPVLACSGWAEEDLDDAALADGPILRLSKPYSTKTLVSTLERLLDLAGPRFRGAGRPPRADEP